MKEINPIRRTLIVLGVFILILSLSGCTLKYKPNIVPSEQYNLLLQEKKEICKLDEENERYIEYNEIIDNMMYFADTMDLYIRGHNEEYEYVYDIPPDIQNQLRKDIENLYCK